MSNFEKDNSFLANSEKNNQKKGNSNSLHLQKQERYSGPVPRPDGLLKYEQIQAGFANRLISMVEKEQAFRHNLGDKELLFINDKYKNENKYKKRGQWFAFFSIILIVVLCLYAFYKGFSKEGSEIIRYTLVLIVALFIGSIFLIKKNK